MTARTLKKAKSRNGTYRPAAAQAKKVASQAVKAPASQATEGTHIRLPERSDLVEGPEKPVGAPPKVVKAADPRTVSQDPALKKN
jgi:hypothetical protein